MTGIGNPEQMGVFFVFARAFLFSGGIIAAESGGDNLIGGAVNQPLACLGNRKLHRVCFAVVVWNFAGRATEELDHGVVAEAEPIGELQIDNPRERNDASKAGFVSGEAEGELGSGGVAAHYDSL